MANGNGGAMAPVARRGIGKTPLPLSDLVFYNPNRPDATEAIWQPYYDFQSYPTAGSTSFIFFQVPNGQSSKTFADTNMVLPGQFPAPTAFLCTAIMIAFFPGGSISATGTTTVANNNLIDVVNVGQAGYLELTIGSKPYLRDAPLGKFAPNFGVNFSGYGYGGGATTNNVAFAGFSRWAGRYYEITPFLIPQSQNFNVTLTFPTAVTTVATGRIGVILDGFYYRQSQ